MLRYERRVIVSTPVAVGKLESQTTHRISYRELEKLLMDKLFRTEARELLAQAKASPGVWMNHDKIEFRRI